MADWVFFTNHLLVLTAVARQPDLRLREIAREVGITERATHRIITQLVESGYITRTRVGARNRYEVNPDAALRNPRHARQQSGLIIRLLAGNHRGDATHVPRESAEQPLGPEIFRDAFAAAPTGMAIADASGCLVAVNAAFCTMLGYDQHELVGRDHRQLTHPDDIEADEQGFSAVAAGEELEYGREKRYIRRDGELTWTQLRVRSTSDPQQTGVRSIVAQVLDINERKRQEHALADAEERFRSAFENAPIGMALLAPDGRFLKVNTALCQLTGYTETALLTGSLQAITHPQDLDAELAYVEDMLAGRRRAHHMKTRYLHAVAASSR